MQNYKRSIDMTRGGVMGKLLAFAIPLALSGILQLLFNAADLVVIGQFSATSTQSLAAVSSNGALVGLITNISIGLSVGANVVMAQAIGSRDEGRAQRTVHTSILLAIICGIVVGLIGVLCAHAFLTLMKTDAEVIDKATLYLRIYFVGAPANVVFNFGAAILRAKGDTKRPLIYLTLSGVVNAGLNLILVIVAKLDVAGVAIATAVSHCLSAGLVMLALLREDGYCKFDFKKLAISGKELKDIIKIGLPSGMLSSFFSIANVIIQSGINGFGKHVMAGNSTAANLEMFVYVAMNAVSNAATTFAGQNVGARRKDRISLIIRDSCILTVLVSVVMGGAMLLFSAQLAAIYTHDQIVIEGAVKRMIVILPVYFLCCISENIVGCMRGMSYSIQPMVPCFLCICLYRIIWVYTAFARWHTPTMLYLSYPISWALNLVMVTLLYVFVYCKEVLPSKQIRLDRACLEYKRDTATACNVIMV